MHNVGLVAKHAILTILRKRSFWILTFIMPAFLLFFQVYAAIKSSDTENAGDGSGTQTTKIETPSGFPAIGLVDEAEIITRMPAGFPENLFVRYPDQVTARSALETGQVEQYVFIPSDYLTSGKVTIYDQGFQITSNGQDMGLAFNSSNEWILNYLITYNLTGNEQISMALRNPTPGQLAEYHPIKPAQQTDARNQTLVMVIGQAIPYLFYFILLIGSGFLLQSVTAEKENRTVEVLLLSVSPREIMAGKVFGLGLIILLQLLIWLGGGLITLQRSTAFMAVSSLHFPPSFFIWAVLYLILGYLTFGGIMAASGAIAPTAREGNQITYLLILPLLPTLMFASEFAENPHGVLPVILSLFPLSAPSAMVTRLALTEVPIWQILISLTGLAITAYLVITLAGRFFRAESLLSTASFSWRRLLTGWQEK
jgi:ABC-2 type transport system permease protein